MRDKQVNAIFTHLGWQVFRFLDDDIHADGTRIADCGCYKRMRMTWRDQEK